MEGVEQDEEESEAGQGSGQGGYLFTGPEYQAQLKVQRQQLWACAWHDNSTCFAADLSSSCR